MAKLFGNSLLFPVDVIVDSNEASKAEKLMEELKRLGIKVAVAKLEVGDYFIPYGNEGTGILIERKKDEDFINSILDSRIWRQAQSLSDLARESGLSPVIVIEGDLWETTKSREISPLALVRAIDEVAIELKVPVIYTSSLELTASWIAAKVKSIKREGGEGKFLPYVRRKTASDREKILNALAVITGYETAKKLLERYGSLSKVVSLTLEQLMSVEGIGEIRAKKLYRLFNANYNEKEARAGET